MTILEEKSLKMKRFKDQSLRQWTRSISSQTAYKHFLNVTLETMKTKRKKSPSSYQTAHQAYNVRNLKLTNNSKRAKIKSHLICLEVIQKTEKSSRKIRVKQILIFLRSKGKRRFCLSTHLRVNFKMSRHSLTLSLLCRKENHSANKARSLTRFLKIIIE